MSSLAQVIRVSVEEELNLKGVNNFRDLSSKECGKVGGQMVKRALTLAWEQTGEEEEYSYAPITPEFYTKNKSSFH